MTPARRMRLAVLDGGDEPIIVWDDNVIAKAVVARMVAHQIGLRGKKVRMRRWWRHEIIDYDLSDDDQRRVHEAVSEALHDLSRQVARL